MPCFPRVILRDYRHIGYSGSPIVAPLSSITARDFNLHATHTSTAPHKTYSSTCVVHLEYHLPMYPLRSIIIGIDTLR